MTGTLSSVSKRKPITLREEMSLDRIVKRNSRKKDGELRNTYRYF